jgi:hypothetical protein
MAHDRSLLEALRRDLRDAPECFCVGGDLCLAHQALAIAERYEQALCEAAQLRRLVVRVHAILQLGERDDTYNSGVIGGALAEIEKGGFA